MSKQYKQLNLEERDQIYLLLRQDKKQRDTYILVSKHVSTRPSASEAAENFSSIKTDIVPIAAPSRKTQRVADKAPSVLLPQNKFLIVRRLLSKTLKEQFLRRGTIVSSSLRKRTRNSTHLPSFQSSSWLRTKKRGGETTLYSSP